jgi:hypothetical protein
VTSEAAKNSVPPRFFKGYIYWAGREPLRIYAPDGHQMPVFPASKGTPQAIAVDINGALAVAWTAPSTGGVDLYDSSGALVRTIQTGLYLPAFLSFAEDHCLWTLGWQVIGRPYNPARDDYMIVRKFLPNGQQAGAYLPRSQFPDGLEPGDETWRQTNCITLSHDRAGLFVNSGMNSNKTEWVEIDLDGNLRGRWRLDQFVNELRIAFTADDYVALRESLGGAARDHIRNLSGDQLPWYVACFSASGRSVGTLIIALGAVLAALSGNAT